MGGGGGGILSVLAPVQKVLNVVNDPMGEITGFNESGDYNMISDPLQLAAEAPEATPIPIPGQPAEVDTVAISKRAADAEAPRLKKRKGSAATIVTSGMGVPGAAPTRKSTLGE